MSEVRAIACPRCERDISFDPILSGEVFCSYCDRWIMVIRDGDLMEDPAFSDPSTPEAQMRLDGIIECATQVDYWWRRLRAATTLLDQGEAATALNNATADMRSWLPGWDMDSDTMPWEREQSAE